MVHFSIAVLYKVIMNGRANLTCKCCVSRCCKLSEYQLFNYSEKDRL